MFPHLAKLLEGDYYLEVFVVSDRFIAQVVRDRGGSSRDVAFRAVHEQMDIALVQLNNEAAAYLEKQ